jgi:hypothetical protein
MLMQTPNGTILRKGTQSGPLPMDLRCPLYMAHYDSA